MRQYQLPTPTSDTSCPHCEGRGRQLDGKGLVATGLERERAHGPDCPAAPRRRLQRLVALAVMVSASGLSLPTCSGGLHQQQETGLDNGTVGMAELPDAPGDAA